MPSDKYSLCIYGETEAQREEGFAENPERRPRGMRRGHFTLGVGTTLDQLDLYPLPVLGPSPHWTACHLPSSIPLFHSPPTKKYPKLIPSDSWVKPYQGPGNQVEGFSAWTGEHQGLDWQVNGG